MRIQAVPRSSRTCCLTIHAMVSIRIRVNTTYVSLFLVHGMLNEGFSFRLSESPSEHTGSLSTTCSSYIYGNAMVAHADHVVYKSHPLPSELFNV